MARYKTVLKILAVGLFLATAYFEPMSAIVFGILFAVIFACLALRIYFMPIKSKLDYIAKFKSRHGIPQGERSIIMTADAGYIFPTPTATIWK
jgi:hypothetical protein